jgi:hypothetical protein
LRAAKAVDEYTLSCRDDGRLRKRVGDLSRSDSFRSWTFGSASTLRAQSMAKVLTWKLSLEQSNT